MNMSIRCAITDCRYNNTNECYCTLDTIDIVKNNKEDVNSKASTDCGSFELRQ